MSKEIINPTDVMWTLLHKRFPAGEYVVLKEVRDAAGSHASRSADGLVVALWPSRGLYIQGLEVKSFRSDWLRELKKPEKAESVFRFCDFWWVIATKEDIVKVEELPKTWGLMVMVNNKLKVIVDAPKLTPQPVNNHFLAAILKRATAEMIPISSIADQLSEARKQARERAEFSAAQKGKDYEHAYNQLREGIDKFQLASGLSLDNWSAQKMGEAVRFVMDGGLERQRKLLDDLHDRSLRVSASVFTVLQELKQSDIDNEKKVENETSTS